VNSGRILRFDCLTNEELERGKFERATEGERQSILADLRRSDAFNWEQHARFDAAECVVTFRSPWDATHSLGFVMLSHDILKPKEALAAQVSANPVLYLEYIAVGKDLKRCGLGTRIVRWVMQTALAKGWREIALGADEGCETWEFWRQMTFTHTNLVKGSLPSCTRPA